MLLMNAYFVFDQRPSLRGLGAEFWPAGGPISSDRHIGCLGFVNDRKFKCRQKAIENNQLLAQDEYDSGSITIDHTRHRR
jgi:hypothetical protein